MRVEYINPFIQASNSVINAICGVDSKIGRVSLKTSTLVLSNLVIVIQVSGDIDGRIFFEMDKETAKKIAASMMKGRLVARLDELSRSAIGEMGSMITGNAGTIFSQNAINVLVNSPTILMGDKIEMQNKIPTFVIPVKLDKLGQMKIYINAKEVEENPN